MTRSKSRKGTRGVLKRSTVLKKTSKEYGSQSQFGSKSNVDIQDASNDRKIDVLGSRTNISDEFNKLNKENSEKNQSADPSRDFNLNDTTIHYDSSRIEDAKPPLNPDKSNFAFGMHPLGADNVVIDPKYPPHFYPYLYPHLFPHLFPKLFPLYADSYKEVVKRKKKKKEEESEKRNIVVVLPDGRHIHMNKKEFMAYQLALGQVGMNMGPGTSFKKDPLENELSDDFSQSAGSGAGNSRFSASKSNLSASNSDRLGSQSNILTNTNTRNSVQRSPTIISAISGPGANQGLSGSKNPSLQPSSQVSIKSSHQPSSQQREPDKPQPIIEDDEVNENF